MSTLNRRALLGAGVVVGVAVAAPVAAARPDRMAERVRRWRARWVRTTDHLVAQRSRRLARRQAPAAERDAVLARYAPIAAGTAAVDIAKDLWRVPVEDQVHPDVQDLTRDLADAAGRGHAARRDVLAAWLDGPGRQQDPDGSRVLGVLSDLDDELVGSEVTPARQQQVRDTLTALRAEGSGPALRRRARRLLQRADRLDSVARQYAAEPGRARLLRPRDPSVDARVQAAVESGPPSGRRRAPPTAGQIVGYIALGGVAVVGGLFVFAGVVCFGCDPEFGFTAIVFGALIIGGAWLGVRAIHRRREEDQMIFGAARALPVPVGRRRVRAGGWWDSGLLVHGGQAVAVEATGTLLATGGWAPTPDGAEEPAGPGAPLPRAPLGALLGRVGDRTVLLGEAGQAPGSASGRLLLGVNLPPETRAVGGFDVALFTRAG